ncbi:hypothetical protein ZOD2009_13536 [Haladaptatus paucihalophilus DX253]|uniref:Uncharacterized protein n=1 Tax=Haladaptatus paucihalophilus DX253 TaxID=797209 RepID=E7QV71_HALPU|nr:hypothetical protein [Haladaptatus paucihalophilus]EFW91589.1 hypothetical protein ZOD2009_13536 [Haladaptatus paucihalophilus DX253]SHL23724.1 hypothetical protein SAMN05444342_3375 [Haladaptatus paucihalophilus DX253]
MVISLAQVGADASGSVVRFIGSGLLSVSAAIFGFYAFRNLRLNRLESQRPFWRYLVSIGVAGVLYGALGMVGVLSPGRWLLALGHAALLFCTVFLAFAMRELYYNSTLAPPSDERRIPLSQLRRIEVGFVGIILLELVVVLLLGHGSVVSLVKGLGSLSFAVYGLVFAERLESLARGTSIDTLRRHLLPVLVCSGLLGLADLGVVVGVESLLVSSVESVFVVMIGAFLLTATIRLQQNVRGLSTR